jgi:hypothetical protein
MQAAFPLRRFPIQALVIVLAMFALLVLGGAGGYWLRSLAPQAVSTSTVNVPAPAAQAGNAAGIAGATANDDVDHRIGGVK